MKASSSLTSSSSSSTQAVPTSQTRLKSSIVNQSDLPAIIPLDYDYRTMAPSTIQISQLSDETIYNTYTSSRSHQHQQQQQQQQRQHPKPSVINENNFEYNSLFGDPVVPRLRFEEFSRDNHFTNSFEENSSEENRHQFQVCSETNSYTGRKSQHSPNTAKPLEIRNKRCETTAAFTSTYTTTSSLSSRYSSIISRLKPPDIEILSNSSDTFNINSSQPINLPYIKSNDRLSEIGDNHMMNNPSIHRMSYTTYIPLLDTGTQVHSTRDFRKMPELRPSSKNVLSIKSDQMPIDSPVAAMINDSISSNSSGGDGDKDDQHNESHQKLESDKPMVHGGGSCTRNQNNITTLSSSNSYLCLDNNTPQGYNDEECKSQISQNDCSQLHEKALGSTAGSTRNTVDTQKPHDMSSLILKKSVTIGGAFRVKEPRFHKNPSFIIVNEKPPYYAPYLESSGINDSHKKEMKQDDAKSVKTATMNRYLNQNYLSSSEVKLPHLFRPSVQFNISTDSGLDNNKTFPVQNFSDDMSYGQGNLPLQRRCNSSLPYIMDMDLDTSTLSKNTNTAQSAYAKPFAARRLYRSDLDLGPEKVVIPPGAMPRPLKPNPNPTRKHKGLLKVLNGYEYQSRIPLRSNWTSMDDMFLEHTKKKQKPLSILQNKYRRRSSSTSPSRRSSTVTTSDRRSSNFSTITTSDFSFRRSSITGKHPTQMQSAKSVFQLLNRISNRTKPLVSFNKKSIRGQRSRSKMVKHIPHLSPILGTPNKDSQTPQSPKIENNENHVCENSEVNSLNVLDDATKRDSLCDISIQHQSKSNRSNSQISLRAHSRASTKSIETTLSQLNFKNAFRGTSAKLNGKGSSRIPSRSTSRASIQPIDGTAAPGTNSGTNSTISLGKKIIKNKYPITNMASEQSKQKSRIFSRRKSSVSDAEFRLTRYIKESANLSDKVKTKRKVKETSKTESKQNNERRNSHSRIPIRNEIYRSKSPTQRKAPLDTGLKRISSLKVNLKGFSKRGFSSKKHQPSEYKHSKTEETESISEDKKDTQKEDQPIKEDQSANMRSTEQKAKVPSNGNKKLLVSKPDKKEKKAKANTRTKILDKKTDKHVITAVKRGTKKSNESSKKTVSDNSQAAVAKETENNDGGISARTTPIDSSIKTSTVAGRDIKRQPSATSIKRINSRSSLLSKKHSDSSLNLKKHTNENIKTEKGIGGRTSSSEALSALPNALTGKSHRQSPDMVMKTITEPPNDKQITSNHQNHVETQDSESTQSPISNVREVTSPTSSVTTVVENKTNQTTTNSVSRQGTVDDLNVHDLSNNISPLPITQPIEATVSILNGDTKKPLNLILNDSSSLADKTHILKEPLITDRVSERAISIMPQVDNESVNNQTYQLVKTATIADSITDGSEAATTLIEKQIYDNSIKGLETEAKRHSPDGQGGSNAPSSVDVCIANNNNNNNNNNNISNKDDLDTKNITDDNVKKSSNCLRNCCQYYFRCCIPCRRSQRCTCLRCLRCSRCPRKKADNLKLSHSTDEIETERASVTSSAAISCSPTASATNLEMIDEKSNLDKSKKNTFLRKLCCCFYCKRKKSGKSKISFSESEISENNNIQTISNESQEINALEPVGPSKQRKFCVCLSKIFCCRSVNKIDPKTGHDIEIKNCCFCIPCRKKRDLRETTRAWHDVEAGLETNNTIDSNIHEQLAEQEEQPQQQQQQQQQQQRQQQQNCCKRWCKFLFCCWCWHCRCRCCNCCRRKKQSPPPPPPPTKIDTERRRSSIKKPPEDTRRRLHVDLIEYNSKMKAAIPILPLWLAWLCAICNVVVPGLGTLLSGFFCICVGIPRFSQYDSAKARVGSLIINIIVAVSQLFCVLFCFVGWGWSIWWATIMLKVAKKLCKIRRVERLELEEEQRQADLAQQQAQQQQQQQLTPAKIAASK